MLLALLAIVGTGFQLGFGSSMDNAYADYAIELLQLTSPNGSSVISPFSVASVLSMVYAGAEGNTKQEMINVLARGQNPEEFKKYMLSLLADISRNTQDYTLETANRLYIQNGLTLKESFVDIIRKHYTGQMKRVNFLEERVAIAQETNQWVDEMTHGKIRGILRAEDISVNTKLMLFNAVYFKGSWTEKFDIRFTEEQPFHIAPGQEIMVPMLAKQDFYPYYEDEEVKVLGIPYGSEEQMHMFFILPNTRFGLPMMEQSLYGRKLLDYIRKIEGKEDVNVRIPKFKLEKDVNLVNALRHMGMESSFGPSANFTGITSHRPLFIGDIKQRAVIEVNEEGTEAAAATCTSEVDFSLPSYDFRADHPFLFAIIKDLRTILFFGRFAGPDQD